MYSSTNIIRVIRSRRIRWAGHVARAERLYVHTGFWCGGLREGVNLEDPRLDGKISFKCILKWDGDMDWIDLPPNRDRWRALANAVMNSRVS